MAFERMLPQDGILNSLHDLILKRKAIRKDKNGVVHDGEYPNEYFINTPAFFSTPATLGNKNKDELLYGFRHCIIQNRLIRESKTDEEYTIKDLIQEFDMEYAMDHLNTMNKEGSNNNRKLLITTSQETTSKVDNIQNEKKGWGLFKRK